MSSTQAAVAPPRDSDLDDLLRRSGRALEAALLLIREENELVEISTLLEVASARGHFTPSEEEKVLEV